nr:hypothetical protein GPVRGNEL_GPVRGNEL_CDS_0050 [Caudoviricetes sp.]
MRDCILGEIIRNARFGFVFALIHSDLNTTKGMTRKCVREPFLCEIRLCINIVYQ